VDQEKRVDFVLEEFVANADEAANKQDDDAVAATLGKEDAVAATLSHVVGQLQVISNTMALLEERVSITEARVASITRANADLLPHADDN